MVKLFPWAAVVLWMGLIFYLSSQVAEQSNNLSTGFTEIILEAIKRIVPNVNFDIMSINHFVRKNAHFFTYLVLGVLVLNAFRRSGIYGYKSIVLAIVVCILYAVSDEVHQLFVPGRGAQVKDVIIDSVGSAVGIAVYLVFSWANIVK